MQIEGVLPASERSFSRLPDQVSAGRYLQDDDRLAAYVGVRLAQRLDLHEGSRFVLTAQSAAGDIAGQLVRVAGTFRTGIPEVDEGTVQIPIETARAWLGVPGAATSVAVLLADSRGTARVARLLRMRLAADSSVRVLTWPQTAPELEAAVHVDDTGGYIFMAILFTIVALAILNAVLMSVLNRRREFGVLRALGLRSRDTGLVVFGEGLMLSLVSGAAGMVLGFAVVWVFWRHGLDISGLIERRLLHGGYDHRSRHCSRVPRHGAGAESGVHRDHWRTRVPLSRAAGHAHRSCRSHEVRTMNETLRTLDLRKEYAQEPAPIVAVRDVSLDIERGDFVALAGPSGSGKSTLLNLLGGLTRPTHGKIWVAGQELTSLSEREMSRLRLEQIGFVFQAYNLLPVLSARENAEFTLLLRGVPSAERRTRVDALFHEIGLDGLEDRRPAHLSGGQQQRVAVARAVVGEPAIVLADEPTANLDSVSSAALLDVMERLNRERGTTFIFATHDPRVMERARRLVHLVDGAVSEDVRQAAVLA